MLIVYSLIESATQKNLVRNTYVNRFILSIYVCEYLVLYKLYNLVLIQLFLECRKLMRHSSYLLMKNKKSWMNLRNWKKRFAWPFFTLSRLGNLFPLKYFDNKLFPFISRCWWKIYQKPQWSLLQWKRRTRYENNPSAFLVHPLILI